MGALQPHDLEPGSESNGNLPFSYLCCFLGWFSLANAPLLLRCSHLCELPWSYSHAACFQSRGRAEQSDCLVTLQSIAGGAW